jgi:putative transposase
MLAMILKPWNFIMVALAGLMNRQQQDAITYLKEENRVLREKLGTGRIILNNSQKRRLARAAAKLGRDGLRQLGSIFAPDTLLRWHHWLIARKYDGSSCRGKTGPEPTKTKMVLDLVLRFAAENPDWGYGRITGELKALGYEVSWQTVRRIMKEHGLLNDPDGPSKMTWKDFLQSHWESMSACDFFSVEAWGFTGLTRYMVFFVIDMASRKVEIAGIQQVPCQRHMLQYARNLTDAENGFLKDKRYLIHDRDPLFTEEFRKTLAAGGVRCLKMPKWSPNLNAYSESFVRTVKRECLDKMILFGESHVRHVIEQYISHYNIDRPHQGMGNRKLTEPPEPPPKEGIVRCRQRLGGLLKSYFREAA